MNILKEFFKSCKTRLIDQATNKIRFENSQPKLCFKLNSKIASPG